MRHDFDSLDQPGQETREPVSFAGIAYNVTGALFLIALFIIATNP